MKQTKWVSALEASMSTGSGFVVAMLIWAFIIPLIFPRMAGPVEENIVVTAIFTVASVVRSFFWRRLFNNGFYATMVIWWNWIRIRVMSKRLAAGDDSGKVGGDRVTKGTATQGWVGVHRTGRECFCERCLAARMKIEDGLGD